MTSLTEQNISRILEWDSFIELAQKEAKTEPAQAHLQDLKDLSFWAPNLSQAQTLQQETQEVTPLLDRDALWGPLVELADPIQLFDRLSRGSALEIQEWVTLRQWLYAIDSWTQVPREDITGKRFRQALALLPNSKAPLRILESVLTPEGELSEKASPKLSSLYSEIRSLKREISIVLDHLVKTFSQKGVLQENFTDVRDGRYVLPIKISSQNEVEGIIYEASASRQTVFVEPKEVGGLNNRLRQRQNDLIQEIFQVLENTRQRIQPFIPEIQAGTQILIHWDTVQAKARLGRRYSGKAIQVTEDLSFSLKHTAHPFLWWSLQPEAIIRNEVELHLPSQCLLLTGPNTGGKTVLLKTLGLAGICARTGFPFPASVSPQVPFFDSFFADLGDAQSIEQHLSTFSGHVLKFKNILECMTQRSLILIDELNSATDPEEGAAFGRAVLETILERGALMVTTTHDPHLKALALSDERILNASMTFDETARTPTYKMLLGVPGRSRALETAERLGIHPNVIQRAKGYLTREHVEFEKLIGKLDTDTRESTRLRKEAEQLHQEALRLKDEWTQRTETSLDEMMHKTRTKLRRILEQAQEEVRTLVRKLDEVKNRKEVDQTRSFLNESFQNSLQKLNTALEEEAPDVARALHHKQSLQAAIQLPLGNEKTLQVGDEVRIRKWKTTGKIVEQIGPKFKVAMGTLQMTLSLAEIEGLPRNKTKAPAVHTFLEGSATSSGGAEPASTLDLRGVRFEEAMSQLARYLNEEYRNAHFMQVTIVHGLGTGALREGTLKLLRKLPYVRSFQDGGPGNGGAGATIVEFDR